MFVHLDEDGQLLLTPWLRDNYKHLCVNSREGSLQSKACTVLT